MIPIFARERPYVEGYQPGPNPAVNPTPAGGVVSANIPSAPVTLLR